MAEPGPFCGGLTAFDLNLILFLLCGTTFFLGVAVLFLMGTLNILSKHE